jgi:hypothetical protein
MKLFGNVIFYLFFVGIILLLVGYYPITFLVALWQVENAKNWETTKCIVSCRRDKTKSFIGYSTDYRINYGFKSRLEQPEIPYEIGSRDYEPLRMDPKLTKEEWAKKKREYFENQERLLEKRRNDRQEKRETYQLKKQIFEKEQQKYMSEGTRYFSIFQINGWRYWGNHGWSEICHDEFGRNLRKPGFEADCYLDPQNPENAVFFRKLGLNRAWTVILVLNTLFLFGCLWLAFYLFRHDWKRQQNQTSVFFA